MRIIALTNDYLPCRQHRLAHRAVSALNRVVGKIRVVIIMICAMRLVCVSAETIEVMLMMLGLRRQPVQAFAKQRNAGED
jgi:hypothetical protein